MTRKRQTKGPRTPATKAVATVDGLEASGGGGVENGTASSRTDSGPTSQSVNEAVTQSGTGSGTGAGWSETFDSSLPTGRVTTRTSSSSTPESSGASCRITSSSAVAPKVPAFSPAASTS